MLHTCTYVHGCPTSINCLSMCSLEAGTETKRGVSMLLGFNFCEGKGEARRFGRGIRCDKWPVIKTWPTQWRKFCKYCPGVSRTGLEWKSRSTHQVTRWGLPAEAAPQLQQVWKGALPTAGQKALPYTGTGVACPSVGRTLQWFLRPSVLDCLNVNNIWTWFSRRTLRSLLGTDQHCAQCAQHWSTSFFVPILRYSGTEGFYFIWS